MIPEMDETPSLHFFNLFFTFLPSAIGLSSSVFSPHVLCASTSFDKDLILSLRGDISWD